MSPLIPTGHLTVTAAIDRIVELRQGGDSSRLLTEDERATLRNWRDWRDQLNRRQPEPVTPVPKVGDRGVFAARTSGKKYSHVLVEAKPERPDMTREVLRDLEEKEAFFNEQQRVAEKELRQLLYTGRVPLKIFTEDGTLIETPAHVWGGSQWHEALTSSSITFRLGILSVTGFPMIPRDALEAAFNPDGTVKEESESAAPKAAVEDEPKQPKRGRPPEWDWEGALAHVVAVADGKDGLPERQCDIEHLVADWFTENKDNHPVESAIREKVSSWCAEVLGKASNSQTGN